MKQNKLNVLAMNQRVLEYLKQNRALWQDFTPMAEQVTILEQSIANRRDRLARQQTAIGGATATKNDAQRAAVEETLRLARFANGYALANHDTDLYAQTARGRNYLLRLPDDQGLAVLTQMLDAIEPKLGQLAPYGVSAADIATARQKVEAATQLRNAARSAIDARKTAGEALPGEERSGRQALKVIDNIIHYFDYTQPEFVAGYRNARIIVDEGVRHENPPAPPVSG